MGRSVRIPLECSRRFRLRPWRLVWVWLIHRLGQPAVRSGNRLLMNRMSKRRGELGKVPPFGRNGRASFWIVVRLRVLTQPPLRWAWRCLALVRGNPDRRRAAALSSRWLTRIPRSLRIECLRVVRRCSPVRRARFLRFWRLPVLASASRRCRGRLRSPYLTRRLLPTGSDRFGKKPLGSRGLHRGLELLGISWKAT